MTHTLRSCFRLFFNSLREGHEEDTSTDVETLRILLLLLTLSRDVSLVNEQDFLQFFQGSRIERMEDEGLEYTLEWIHCCQERP